TATPQYRTIPRNISPFVADSFWDTLSSRAGTGCRHTGPILARLARMAPGIFSFRNALPGQRQFRPHGNKRALLRNCVITFGKNVRVWAIVYALAGGATCALNLWHVSAPDLRRFLLYLVC